MSIQRTTLNSLCIALSLALGGGCDQTDSAAARDKAAAKSDDNAEAVAKVLGTWIATDDSGNELEFTKDRLTRTYPKSGAKPLVSVYKVEKHEGKTIEISVQLELSGGKLMQADNQVITLSDDGTLAIKNAANGSGGTFKKK